MMVLVVGAGFRPEMSENERLIIQEIIKAQEQKEQEEKEMIQNIEKSILKYEDLDLSEIGFRKSYSFGKKTNYINTSKHNKFYKR